jgi:hypothetical protein
MSANTHITRVPSRLLNQFLMRVIVSRLGFRLTEVTSNVNAAALGPARYHSKQASIPFQRFNRRGWTT